MKRLEHWLAESQKLETQLVAMRAEMREDELYGPSDLLAQCISNTRRMVREVTKYMEAECSR